MQEKIGTNIQIICLLKHMKSLTKEEETGRAESGQPGNVSMWFGNGKYVFLVKNNTF